MATRTVYCNADAGILSGGGGNGLGDTMWAIYDGTYIGRMFLNFAWNWSSMVTITSAVLHIQSGNTFSKPNPALNIYRCTQAWTEGDYDGGDTNTNSSNAPGVTWADQPSVTSAIAFDPGTGSSTWYTKDITSHVQYFFAHQSQAYGISIRSRNEASSAGNWDAHQRSVAQAYIVITYTTNVAPNAPSGIKIGLAGVPQSSGAKFDKSADLHLTCTYSDNDGDPMSAYQYDVDACASNGATPDWASPALSGTVSSSTASIDQTLAVSGLSRGQWYCARIRATDGVTGYGAYSYIWFRINALPVATLTSNTGNHLAKVVYTAGSGWATPRLVVSWTYSDAESATQAGYEVFIKNDSDGTTWHDIVAEPSSDTSLIVPYDLTRGNKYRVKVAVKDDMEWGDYSTEHIVKAEWGLSTHTADLTSVPTAWSLASMNVSKDASKNDVVVEYNSADDAGGTNLGAWKATLGEVTKRQFIRYRVWMYTWGGSAASPSFDDITFSYTTATIVPDDWTLGTGCIIETGDRVFGTQCLSITGSAGAFREAYQTLACEQNSDYIIQARIKTTADPSKVGLQVRDTSGFSYLISDTRATYSGSQWYTVVSEPFNSGSFSQLRVACFADDTTAIALFDAIKLEKATVASPWTPAFLSPSTVLDGGGVVIDGAASPNGGVFRLRGAAGTDADVVDLTDHGLTFGGDVEVSSDGAGELQIAGDAAISGDLVVTGALTRSTPATGPIVRTYLVAGGATAWVKPAGLSHIVVECQGGGGGGGGTATTSTGQGAMGGHGSGGGYVRKLILASALTSAGDGGSYTATPGDGGNGGTAGNNAGSSGSASTFAGTGITTVSGSGGAGGAGSAAGAGSIGGANGAAQGGTGGDFTVYSGEGVRPRGFADTLWVGGASGGSFLGGGQVPAMTGGGGTGSTYGGGGTGATAVASTSARAGGKGGAGIVIITEYYN